MIRSYAVITPARDEAGNLPRVAESLAAQTVLPVSWIIVDNGSTDETSDIAEQLAGMHAWVRVLTLEGASAPDRGAPVVRALNSGLSMLTEHPPQVVVNVDADISFGPDYFELLLSKFDEDPSLGIASGCAYELQQGRWCGRHVTGTTVWGASRAYRWECLQAVLPLEERVAWDGIDEFKANARGWRTQTFEGIPFKHHRREGERDGTMWRARRQQGNAAYYVGYRPWYLVLRALWHTRRESSALAMIWGYAGAAVRREPRMSDVEARLYLRRQQSPLRLGSRLAEAAGRRSRPA